MTKVHPTRSPELDADLFAVYARLAAEWWASPSTWILAFQGHDGSMYLYVMSSAFGKSPE